MNQKQDEDQNKLQWNPMDSRNTIGGFAKTTSVFEEVTNLASSIVGQFIYVLFITYLVAETDGPIFLNIIAIVSTVIGLWIQYRAYKAIRNLANEDTVEGFSMLYQLRWRYKVLKSIFFLPLTLIFVYILNRWFLQQWMGAFYQEISSVWLLVGIVLYSFVNAAIDMLHYFQYKRHLPKAGNKTQVTQIAALIDEKISLVSSIVQTPLFVVLVILFSVPLLKNIPGLTSIIGIWSIIVLVFVGISFILMPILSVITIKRIQSMDFSKFSEPEKPQNSEQSVSATLNRISDSEPKLAVLYGIWNTKSYGVEVLGKGKQYLPENTLIITPNRLVLLVVPVFGAGTVMGGIDYTSNTNIWGRGDIKAKAEDLFAKQTLDEIVGDNEGSFALPFDEIKEVKLVKKGFVNVPRLEIQTADGQKRSYLWIDKEYLNQIENLLPGLLGDRFIVV